MEAVVSFRISCDNRAPSRKLSGLICCHLMTFQGPETHLDRQGVLKNIVLGTKNMKIGQLWPVLALSDPF